MKLKYYVMLFSALTFMGFVANGSYAEVPGNDLCSDAIGPLAVDSVTSGSTVDATVDYPPDLLCGTDVTAPGVWYTVTGTGNTMTASTCDSANYDTKINIYCADCAEPTCVAGNDDSGGCGSFTSIVSWKSQEGATYLILVQGYGGQTGSFDLAILDNGVPVTADVNCEEEPDPDKFNIDIKPGSDPNSIAIDKCKGVLPVAILGDEFFDVTTIDVTTLGFTTQYSFPAISTPSHDLTNPKTYSSHLQDVNEDGFMDLMSHYKCSDLNITPYDTEGCLVTYTLAPPTDPGSNCFKAREDTGCDDEVCETNVCNYDDYCCENEWDFICVEEAEFICSGDFPIVQKTGCDTIRTIVPPLPQNNCFEAHETTGCQNKRCEETVCAIDPYCCDVGWDSKCVEEAAELCQ